MKLQAERSHWSALIEYFKRAPPDHAGIPAINHAKPFHCAPTTAIKDAGDRRIDTVYYQFSGSGYRPDEMMKLSLNRCQIMEDVGMIKLYIVQNGGSRPVVHHLGALIEEGSIVFIGFDNEMALFSQLCRYPKIDWDTPDEKPGFQSDIL